MALSPKNKYASKAKALLARPAAGQPRFGSPGHPLIVAPRPVPRPVVPRVAPRPAAPAYPSIYAPLSPDAITARARADIYGPYNGIIDATVNGLLGKAAYQSDQERAQTSRLMAALAPYAARIRGYTGDAASAAAGTGQGIGGQVSAQGAQLAAALGAKLGGINAPGQTVDQVAGGAGQVGQAAGATIGALGSAEHDRLHGVGEANAAWADAQPGIAQLDSLARLGLIQQDLSGNLASQIGALQIEAERAYMDRVDKLQGLEYDKAQARQTLAQQARSAKQDATDRRMESIALKLSYGMPLTGQEKYLLNHYGMSAGTAQTLIRGNQAQAAQAASARQHAADNATRVKIQTARDNAAAARQRAHDAAAAARQANHDAAMLERQGKHEAAASARARANNKAAAARQAQKDAAAWDRQAAKIAAARKTQPTRPGGDIPGQVGTTTGSGSGYFPGG